MIIRSSDGDSIVNFDNMSLLQVEKRNDKYYVMAYDTGSDTGIPMEEYSTHDKAVKVIDDIQRCYISEYSMGVYQMPEGD